MLYFIFENIIILNYKGLLLTISGICTCLQGFGGSDCSFDISSPPFISRTSDNGLCDKSTESCDEITIYGKYFVSNPNASCLMKRTGVIYNYINVSLMSFIFTYLICQQLLQRDFIFSTIQAGCHLIKKCIRQN